MRNQDYLEKNIDRLLGSIEPEKKLPRDKRRQILAELIKQSQSPTQSTRKFVMSNRWLKFAAAAVLVIAAVVGSLVFITEPARQKVQPADLEQKAIVEAPGKSEPGWAIVAADLATEKKLAEELERVEQMFAAGNIDGLIAMLGSDNSQVSSAAANYLWQFDDPMAVAALDRFSEEPAAVEPNGVVHEGQPELTESTSGVEKQASGEAENVLDLTVVNKQTGEPMEGVRLEIVINQNETDVLTDKQGRYRLDFGQKPPGLLHIQALKERFAPKLLWFHTKGSVLQIPASYTLALEPGISIGGLVVDEQGEPVEGATVRIDIHDMCADCVERIGLRECRKRTDADGRWLLDTVPAEPGHLSIRASHPDYVDEKINDDMTGNLDKLRAGTAVMVMKKGLSLTGVVLTADGEPIEGATIMQGEHRWGTNYPETTSDAFGQFSFAKAKSGDMVLTVQAEGYSPELKKIMVNQETEPVEFRLMPGQTIRGRIVDVNDNPIEGVSVVVEHWRQHNTIKMKTKTDAEGRFEWADAPKEEVLFSISASGYMRVNWLALWPSEDEHVIIMNRPLRISGRVLDVDSNEPVNNFSLIPGIEREDRDAMTWQWYKLVKFDNGQYEYKFSELRECYRIRIEADGYEPAVSDVFSVEQSNANYDFRLKKASGLSGIVYLPDNQPAAGAEVIVCTASQHVYIRNGKNSMRQASCYVTTGPDGRFSFPLQTEPYLLVVLHDKGYAGVTEEQLAESPDIILESWGRVEGVLFVGDLPGKAEKIRLSYDDMNPLPGPPRPSFQYNAITDVNGHFVMDRLWAGPATLYGHGSSEPVEVVPGATARVVLGGEGRVVIGRIKVPADYGEQADLASAMRWISIEPPYPDDYEQMTPDEKQAWYSRWRNSDEGRAEYRSYRFNIQKDGSFRIEDVIAGKYKLITYVYELPRWMQCSPQVGSLKYVFTVPAIPAGFTDEPFDIGTHQLEMKTWPKAGDLAPDFEAQTLDGARLNLADNAGRVVVLGVQTESGGKEAIERLKKVYEVFGGDEEFVMISVLYGPDVEDASRAAEQNGLAGLICYADEHLRDVLTNRWGVPRGCPYAFVVDREGRIAAKCPGFTDLAAAVTAALGR